MPFYEYQCRSCGHHAEVLQKITDAPLRKCPACGRNALVKLVSAPVFRLKGSGWYETDFKGDKDAKRNLAGADSEEKKPDDKKPEEKKADDKAPDKPAAEKPATEATKPAAEKPAATTAATKKAPAAKRVRRSAPARKPSPKGRSRR